MNQDGILEITIRSATLGCAKEKLKEDSSYLFRFVFDYKKQNESNKVKSRKVPLVEGAMNFKDDRLIFNNVDKDKGILEITMAVGNETTGKKFKPTSFYLRDLKVNEEVIAIWDLTAKSEINLKYKLSTNERTSMSRSTTSEGSAATNTTSQSPFTANIDMTSDINAPEAVGFKNKLSFFEKKSIKQPQTTSRRPSTRTSEEMASTTSSKIDDRKSIIPMSLSHNIISIRDTSPIPSKVSSTETSSTTRNRDAPSLTSPIKKVNPNFKSVKQAQMNSQIIEQEIKNNLIKNNLIIRKSQTDVTSLQSNNTDSVAFLTSLDTMVPDNEERMHEAFCESFFLCSFPLENAKVIENSEIYLSPCGHQDCSMLPALQPAILTRFPIKDNKTLELTSLTATICFPSGVKVCYNQDETSKKAIKNYSTPITNQQGDRYYMMTYHFYQKIENGAYTKKYTMHPLKAFLMKFGEDNVDIETCDKKKKKKIEQDLMQCEVFGFEDYVYIPFCACLISKYPYIRQMEKCLETVVRMVNDGQRKLEEVYSLITFLTMGVPIPPIKAKLKFFIPFQSSPIELIGPVYKDMTIINNNMSNLLELFSIENIMTIFRMMLFEQKILFVDNEYNRLSEVTDAFISLLYPFQWIHTYIPIMSDPMMKYLQAFLPFINGINESLMEVARPVLNDAEEGVYIVYINNNTIDINSSTKGKKIKIKDCLKIPELPYEIETKLVNSLKELKRHLDQNKNNRKNLNKNAVDMYIRNTFVDAFVEMLYDYMSYLTILDDYSVFNTEMFIDNRSNSEFYKELTETQLFQQFIQMNTKERNYFNQMIKQRDDYNERRSMKRSNSITGRRTSSCYQSDVKPELQDIFIQSQTENINNESRNSNISPGRALNIGDCYSKYFQIEKVYVIAPYFLNWIGSDVYELESLLAESCFFPEGNLNENKVLKESLRIFDSIRVLSMEQAPKVYKRYIIPGHESQQDTQTTVTPTKFAVTGKIASRVDVFEKKSKEASQRRPTFLGKGKRTDTQLSDKEKENIKDSIKDILGRIFTSENIEEGEKQIFLRLIDTAVGRDLFAKIIYQYNVKRKHMKTVSNLSFEYLNLFLFNAILSMCNLDETPQNLELSVLLTKSAFLYCKLTPQKEQYFILNELLLKAGSFPLWTKENFWAKWFEIILKEANESDESKSFTNQDDLCMYLFQEMTTAMIVLKINKQYIFHCVSQLAKKRFKNPDTAAMLMAEVSKMLSAEL